MPHCFFAASPVDDIQRAILGTTADALAEQSMPDAASAFALRR
jgi:hypothetical protein